MTEGELETVGVVVCLDDEQRNLIIRRADIDERAGQWTLPGGHIDEDDASIEAGAIRELEEEAGLRCEISDLVYLGMPGKKKYYYMTRKWEGNVNVDKPNPKTDQVEHDQWKWSTIDDIKDVKGIGDKIFSKIKDHITIE